MTRLGLSTALALLLCATVTRSAPYAPLNTPDQARQWMYCDSVIVRGDGNGAVGYDREKSIYLLAIAAGSARGQVDSLVIAWHNGGAVPSFRRIQGIHIFTEAVPPGNGQILNLTIFHPDGTSANNHVIFNNETHLYIPLEADSIHVKTEISLPADFCICVW